MVEISILIVTYNRSAVLVEAVESVRSLVAAVDVPCEIVIADDCSDPEHREVIDSIADVSVARTERNSGLGANCNNGYRHCSGRLILQIQDDWIVVGDPTALEGACRFLAAHDDVGIVQLSPVGTDLPVESRTLDGREYRVFRNDHVPWRRRCDIRPYSDNPHLKRREFVESVGPYLEDVPMAWCEAEYQRRVANQSRWKVAQTVDRLFDHVGEEISLNPGGRQNPLVRMLRSIPGGKSTIEPNLRAFLQRLDHLAARVLGR